MSAVYANLFRVGHNDSEFVLEFCQSYASDATRDEAPAVVARVVVTPIGAKELAALLSDSLAQYARLAARGGTQLGGEPA